MLKFGRISSIDAATGMCKVTFDDDGLVSGWLHAGVPNTKDNKDEFPYAIDEHVYCHMTDGLARGVIGGSIYDKKNAPPIANAVVRGTTYKKSGSFSKVNTETGEAEVTLEKITFNGGNNGGILKSEEVKGSDDALVDAVNALKQVFTSWVPVANDGGAALKTAVSTWAGQQLAKKAKATYEDSKILH
jgi:phage baseplate assembly protein gpV